MTASGTNRTRGASSSRKVLQLLLSFSELRPRATVAELAEAAGAPVATTYRYVALLKELQLLEEGAGGRYHLTSCVMPLARAAQVVNDLGRVARPHLESASRELAETVMLFQRFGGSAVCVDRVECERPMRFTAEPGHSFPLGIGASGKMLLALLPEAERGPSLDRLDPARRALVATEVVRAHRAGWAESSGEIDEGVWACSVPVDLRGMSTRTTVLSAAGPASRLDEAARERAVALLTGAAHDISSSAAVFASDPPSVAT